MASPYAVDAIERIGSSHARLSVVFAPATQKGRVGGGSMSRTRWEGMLRVRIWICQQSRCFSCSRRRGPLNRSPSSGMVRKQQTILLSGLGYSTGTVFPSLFYYYHNIGQPADLGAEDMDVATVQTEFRVPYPPVTSGKLLLFPLFYLHDFRA